MNASFFSPGSTGRAALLAVVAALVGWLAIQSALSQTLARSRPDFALRLQPSNGVALDAAFRGVSLSGGLKAPDLNRWATAARGSLRNAPLSAPMMRLVAADSRVPDGTRLFRLAERISRRDALMQLALIEASVASGRVGAALDHYNRALSIYPDMRELLFPILTKAISTPEVRDSLVRFGPARRPWMGPFLAHAATRSPDPASVAALLSKGSFGDPAREPAAVLVGRFVATGDYAAARRQARRAAGADANWLDNAGFASQTWAQPTQPLTWAVAQLPGLDARLIGSGTVLVSAGPGAGGLAIFRIMTPRPGRYRLQFGTAAPGDGSDSARGRIALLCLRNSGQAAIRLAEVPVDPANYGRSATAIDIPPQCDAVRIDFDIDNRTGGGDAGIALDNIALAPLR